MSRPVRITLLGQTFTLRTDESDEHIQAVAKMVDARLRELQSQGAPGDRTLGLFAALTLGDELLKCRERATALDGRVRSRIEAIEAVLQAENVEADPASIHESGDEPDPAADNTAADAELTQ